MAITGFVSIFTALLGCFQRLRQDGPVTAILACASLFMLGWSIYGMVLTFQYGPDDSPCPDPLQPLAWYSIVISFALAGAACCCICLWMATMDRDQQMQMQMAMSENRM